MSFFQEDPFRLANKVMTATFLVIGTSHGSDGMNGYVYISDKPICPPEIPSPLHDMKTITSNKVLYVFPLFPFLGMSYLHV